MPWDCADINGCDLKHGQTANKQTPAVLVLDTPGAARALRSNHLLACLAPRQHRTKAGCLYKVDLPALKCVPHACLTFVDSAA